MTSVSSHCALKPRTVIVLQTHFPGLLLEKDGAHTAGALRQPRLGRPRMLLTGGFGYRTPQQPGQTFLRTARLPKILPHNALSFFTLSFTLGQTCVGSSRLSHPLPAPSPFTLTWGSPNKCLTHLIQSWHLLLGRPGLTQTSKVFCTVDIEGGVREYILGKTVRDTKLGNTEKLLCFQM